MNTSTISRLAHALAERDNANLGIARVRETLEKKAERLIRAWRQAPGIPCDDVETILEEGRLADVADEAERREKRNASAESIAGHMAAHRTAHTPAPDLSHRTLTVRDSATGLAYRVRLPVDVLTLLSHDPNEVAHEAAGRPFVKRAA